MIEAVGKYEFVIDAYLTDFRGKATLPMIGGFMLQCATKHAEERGFGYTYMTGQKRVWVLSRMVIEMIDYPKNDSIFVVNTWVDNVNRLFTERRFSFEDETGREIGYARTLWASIDIETRRPTNVLELKDLVSFIYKDKQCPIDNLNKISSLSDDAECVTKFKVKYSDIDINKHLNSMKYVEHLVDVFDIELFREKDIKRFEINYISEGKYGTMININQKELENSTFILEMKVNDTVVCTSKVVWE